MQYLSTSLFSVFVSPCLPRKQVHLQHLSRFRMHVLICKIYLSLSDLTSLCIIGSGFIYLIRTDFLFYSLVNIPVDIGTTVSVSIHLSMDVQIVSYSGYCKKGCNKQGTACLFKFVVSFSLDKQSKLLNHTAVLFLVTSATSILFSVVAPSSCLPTNSAQFSSVQFSRSFSSHPHQHLLFLVFLMIATLTDVR